MNPSEDKEEQLYDKMFNTSGHYDLIGNKTRLSTEDYMEILRAMKSSGGANYADSMVYYKGKVLGRCPKGTVKIGKTCAPSASPDSFTKYKPGDLGGVDKKQISKLSKAKTIDDIIQAHKEKENTDD